MMADMYFLSADFTEALSEYALSLASDPNRFNALVGVGRSAEALGNQPLAAATYRKLLANCTDASGSAQSQLVHAREVVQ